MLQALKRPGGKSGLLNAADPQFRQHAGYVIEEQAVGCEDNHVFGADLFPVLI